MVKDIEPAPWILLSELDEAMIESSIRIITKHMYGPYDVRFKIVNGTTTSIKVYGRHNYTQKDVMDVAIIRKRNNESTHEFLERTDKIAEEIYMRANAQQNNMTCFIL